MTYTQTWDERYQVMGDTAEEAFTRVAVRDRITMMRFGLNRPLLNVGQLPTFIRFMPDFLTQHTLVECKGVGRDSVLKIKLNQMDTLRQWNKYMPVEFFIYNSFINKYAFATYGEVSHASYVHGSVRDFPEGNAAYFIPLHGLEVSWHEMPT